MSLVIALLGGVVFAIGLAIGGMTQPARVLGFLDVTGSWDATLLFVIGGAVGTYLLLDRVFVRRRTVPVCEASFSLPTKTMPDTRLFVGSCLFGVGWGLAGYCPGPAITSLATHTSGILVFVLAMGGGAAIYEAWLGHKTPIEVSAKEAPAVSR